MPQLYWQAPGMPNRCRQVWVTHWTPFPYLELHLFLLKEELPVSAGHKLALSPCPSSIQPVSPNSCTVQWITGVSPSAKACDPDGALRRWLDLTLLKKSKSPEVFLKRIWERVKLCCFFLCAVQKDLRLWGELITDRIKVCWGSPWALPHPGLCPTPTPLGESQKWSEPNC